MCPFEETLRQAQGERDVLGFNYQKALRIIIELALYITLFPPLVSSDFEQWREIVSRDSSSIKKKPPTFAGGFKI